VDERTETFLLLLGCGAFGGLLGAAFGAIAGALSWGGGRAAGTAAGLAVARAVARVSRTEPTRVGRGALVGAVDGFLFLGLVALGVGFLLHRFGQVDGHILGVLALTGLVLTVAAAALGALAYALLRAGIQALSVSFAAGILGACVGLGLAGWAGFLAGGLGGVALGPLVFLHRTPPRRPGPSAEDSPDKQTGAHRDED
jgi:hypothetical protein